MCCKSMNIQAWSLAWFFQPSRTFQVMCVTLCDWKAPIKKEQGAGLLENYCWRWRAQSSTHGQCTGFLQWESSSQGSSRRCFLSHTHLVCGRHSTRRSIIQITHKSSQVHFIYINHNYRLASQSVQHTPRSVLRPDCSLPMEAQWLLIHIRREQISCFLTPPLQNTSSDAAGIMAHCSRTLQQGWQFAAWPSCLGEGSKFSHHMLTSMSVKIPVTFVGLANTQPLPNTQIMFS